MALLFALDRRAAADELRDARTRHDLVLVDRYVASNAAYGAARLRQDAGGPFVDWVRATEVDRFGVPAPDRQVLVRVPEDVAADRVRSRAAAHAERAPDGYETDADLQRRCAAVYDGLVTRCWLAPWSVLTPSPQGLVRTADKMVTEWIRGRFASGSSVRSDTIET
jgi:dTMP kinase